MRAVLFAFVCVAAVVLGAASAGADQLGDDAVFINPGGGVETDGTDGLSLVFNSETGAAVIPGGFGTTPGADGVAYRNTTQYCCSGSSPMLNIGGTLYGGAGPASGQPSSAIAFAVESMTGTAATSTGTSEGSGSAVMRYTINHNAMEYTIVRTVTYVYPNNSFLDEYEVIIPTGNTESVKLYLGGDTAPGTSDSGTGVETTAPVRTIYSVNPTSEIQLGFGEIPGGAPFDGALVGSFFAPYATVQSGGDIGFSITTAVHDAGIMIQWNLGTAPGTYDRALRHYVGVRGAALTAEFATTTMEVGQSTDLNLEILNTGTDLVTGIDYTVQLPAGLTIDGAASSTCGGTLTATDGSTSVGLAGGQVAGATNCVVTVPVTTGTAGDYSTGPEMVSSVTNAEIAVGVSTLSVTAPKCSRVLTGDYAEDSGIDGQVSRLYIASFRRQPDASGHAFWTGAITRGEWTLRRAAEFFMTSPEFTETYGSLDDADFLDLLYNNIMCRNPDAGGRDFWLAQLGNGMTRARVVLLFSDSPEFKSLTVSS